MCTSSPLHSQNPAALGSPGAPADATAPSAAPSRDLADRIFQATLGSLELFAIVLGKRLGLYECLRDGRGRTAGQLALETGIAPRYAQEWLEQQAVADILVARNVEGAPEARRYVLPERNARVLCDVEDAAFVSPFAEMVVGVARALPEVLEAYRSGRGVPYERYGEFFREGQGAINRPLAVHELCSEWLPSIPDLHARLSDERGARVLEVGCGVGHATIALADAYPHAEVTGCDTDFASIEDARRHAIAAGSRARFVHAPLAEAAKHGTLDLVVIFEALHDVAHPRALLVEARERLAEGGSVFIADERVSDRFVAPGDDVERMIYGWSVSHCLPASMATPGSAALGAVLRSDTVRSLARGAGFREFEIVPIENELFRFYRLR